MANNGTSPRDEVQKRFGTKAELAAQLETRLDLRPGSLRTASNRKLLKLLRLARQRGV